MLEQFRKNFSLWEGHMLEKFVENCLPWEAPHAGAGQEYGKEGATETRCDELTASPFPTSLRGSGGGGREFRGKVKPGKKGGWEQSVFKI